MDRVFDGDVNIYLWGNNALTNGKKVNSEYTEFLIAGCPDWILIDNRKLGWSNAEEFNVPSHINVLAEFNEEEVTKIQVTLTRPEKENAVITKTLVLGVSEDSTIPVYDTEWELYQTHEPGVAVITLINN